MCVLCLCVYVCVSCVSVLVCVCEIIGQGHDVQQSYWRHWMENIGRGHGVHYSQWRNSMASINLYKSYTFLLSIFR